MRGLAGLLCLLLAIGAAPARAEWLRAESPNFVVYSEGSEARLRERITLLENFDSLLRMFTTVDGPAASNKLHVYIVRGRTELNRVRPTRDGVAGFYYASAHGIAAIVDSRVDARANEVLFHEYTHHFMMQYAATAYPVWYIEGFAEFFATADFKPRHTDIGGFSDARIHAVLDQNWLPMDRVLFGTINGLDRTETARFYAQSWLTVHYFFSTPERQASLRRYLARLRTEEPSAALEAATGMNAEALGQELRNYIRARQITYRRLSQPTEPSRPPISVTRLPPGADAMMPYEASLRLGWEPGRADAMLDLVRAAAARHARDPFARRVLAHAEAVYGDGAAADRLLDELLAEMPEDAELLYFKGMRHLRAAEAGEDWDGEAGEARRWFTRAHRADENHFQTLYRYAQSLRSDRRFLSENTTNVLLLAHQLAPQVVEIRMNAAGLLIAQDQPDSAEALLRPLAADPHDAGLRDAARQMIDQARTRGSIEPDQPDSAED